MDDITERIQFNMYRDIVGRQMFCSVSGAVLDIRTAVVIERADGKTIAIVDPEVWATTHGAVRAVMITSRIIIAGVIQPDPCPTCSAERTWGTDPSDEQAERFAWCEACAVATFPSEVS